MSMRPADYRFLAPAWPRTVLLLDGRPGEPEAFAAAGLEATERSPDLVLTDARRAGQAARLHASTVIARGGRARELGRAGYAVRRMIVRPGDAGPRLFVPLDAKGAVRHALVAARPDGARAKRVALRVALLASRLGLPLPGTITVAADGGSPALLQSAAAAAGVELGDDWCLLAGDGDDLRRAVWLGFDESGHGPAWVVKFSRVRGNSSAFEREDEVVPILEALPQVLRRHVPRRLGRFQLDGLHALVETGARGRPLQDALEHGVEAPNLVDDIAAWIVEVGRATPQPSSLRDAEIVRLERDVLPAWRDRGAPAGLATRVVEVAGVLQHNDLGSWNIVCEGGTFTVLDWESNRIGGLPLWDIVYFLTDALTAAGPRDPAVRVEIMLALLRGEAELSGRLFGWLGRAAAAAGVPRELVGPIVTLGWLHHGLSHEVRAVRAVSGGTTANPPSNRGPLQRLGERWLDDPELGIDWPAFARASA
ncbi:MAG TPA: hypothetical protein VG265_07570 [Gaiellaceae bacterium]|nr:hypothetical protein [Gaiellaceae bacterium]